MTRPKVAVHKFSSCDGCQLAFLNAGEDLVTLTTLVDIVHFAEAGFYCEDTLVDIAFVEGSISTAGEKQRIHDIRENSRFLVTIGACATAGGLQALRNMHNYKQWIKGIYAHPEAISLLADSVPIRDHVKVDLELWGCPVNGRQVLGAVRSLLLGVLPIEEQEKVCLECKRQQNVCVTVARGEACMGPVTRSGCGAICPEIERGCYACYGPAERPNTGVLANRFAGFGLLPEEIARRFLFINNHAPEFHLEGLKWQGKKS